MMGACRESAAHAAAMAIIGSGHNQHNQTIFAANKGGLTLSRGLTWKLAVPPPGGNWYELGLAVVDSCQV